VLTIHTYITSLLYYTTLIAQIFFYFPVNTFTIGKKPSLIQQTYSVTNFIIRNVGNIRGCERGVCSPYTLIAQIFLYFPVKTFTIGKKPALIQQTYSVTNFIIRNVGNIRGCERGVCSPYTHNWE